MEGREYVGKRSVWNSEKKRNKWGVGKNKEGWRGKSFSGKEEFLGR